MYLLKKPLANTVEECLEIKDMRPQIRQETGNWLHSSGASCLEEIY